MFYHHKCKASDDKWTHPIYGHGAAVLFWIILSIWWRGPIINFFWMLSMQGNIMYAVHSADHDSGSYFKYFRYWAFVNHAAFVLYALICTWIMGHDNVLIKFIVNSSFCHSMIFFQF